MNIAVIGLGLIGGSFAKAITARTDNVCSGYDINKEVIRSAIDDGAIHNELKADMMKSIDMFIICLHPKQEIDFILENADQFSPDTIIIDTCGIKKAVYSSVNEKLLNKGVNFIGCHPMAGREFSGYGYSLETLFDKASFIIAPEKNTSAEIIKTVQKLAVEIGFKEIIFSDASHHDRTIAYTSQLAHIASNAYIKSPTLKNEHGFTGGSFQDMTRVARLNENMWTDLFMMNKDFLADELHTYIENLQKYYDALVSDDSQTLKQLLKEGRILKENIND